MNTGTDFRNPMGISTLSNRTVKLNKSDEEDSRKPTTMPTVKPQKITTPQPHKAYPEGSKCHLLLLLFKIRTAIEAGFIIGSGQQQVA